METEIQLLLTCIRCDQDRDISQFEGESDTLYEQCLTCRESKQLYNKDFLDSYCRVKEVVLIGDYDKVTRDSRIKGKCTYMSCREEFSKTFRQLIKTGGYCDKCTLSKASKKIRDKLQTQERYSFVYNEKTLKEYCEKQEIRGISIPKEVKRETKIKGSCKRSNCTEFFEKTFRQLVEVSGPYCDTHTMESKVNKATDTYIEKTGYSNPSQNPLVKIQKEKTCIINRGTKYPMQNEEHKQKVANTNIEKYGTVCPLQNPLIEQQIRESFKIKYGCDYPMQCEEIKLKSQETCMKNFGVRNPGKSEEVKEKAKATCREKYGFDFPAQNPDILSKIIKSSFKLKEFNFSSGRTDLVQGNEPQALDELVLLYQESDIVTGVENVPHIEYIDSEGKKHYHTPDIYIISKNKIIEVKSTWTLFLHEEKVLLCQIFAKKQGYNYEIWVYNEKAEKIKTIV